MQSRPLISVIVPVFNAEDYLKECIHSILEQQFDNFEVLLIDDGSTDSSGIICDQLAGCDARIRVIHQTNTGVSIARAKGICESQGDWIIFADADDILYSQHLQKLYETAIAGDYDIVKGSIINTRGKKFIHSEKKILDGTSFLKSLLNDSTFGFIYASIYRKSIFDQDCICTDRSIQIGEDVLVNMLLSKKIVRAKNIADIIYFYRTNPESVMSQKIPHPDYWKRYYEFLKSTQVDPSILPQITHVRIIKQIKAFLEPEISFDLTVFCQLQEDIYQAKKEFDFQSKYSFWFKQKGLFQIYKSFKRIHLQLKSLNHTGHLLKRKIIY